MARSIQESVSTSRTAPLVQWLVEVKKRSRRWMKVKILLGGAVVATLIAVGVLAPLISPYDPNQPDLLAALQAPAYFSDKFFLGTDHIGRDILSRIIYGARISLVIATTVVLVSGIVGVGFGAVSGYFGGRTDFAIQKTVEVVWAFPPLLLAIAILAFLGQGLGILILALVAQRWIP